MGQAAENLNQGEVFEAPKKAGGAKGAEGGADAIGLHGDIGRIREELRRERESQVKNSPYLSEKDKKEALAVVDGEFDVKSAKMMIDHFNTQGEDAARRVADEFSRYPKELRDLYNWDNKTFFERTKVLPRLKKHKELLDAFEKLMGDKVKVHLFSPQSVKAYRDWFVKLPLKEKEGNLANSDLDDPKREKVLARFEELSRPVRREFQVRFYNADLDDREQLIEDIGKEQDKLHKGFGKKIRGKIADDLFAAGSEDAYVNWFENKLSLSEKVQMLAKSDLDDPRRAHLRDAFRRLPPAMQLQNKMEFLGADLEERAALMYRLAPEQMKALDAETAGPETTEQDIQDAVSAALGDMQQKRENFTIMNRTHHLKRRAERRYGARYMEDIQEKALGTDKSAEDLEKDSRGGNRDARTGDEDGALHVRKEDLDLRPEKNDTLRKFVIEHKDRSAAPTNIVLEDHQHQEKTAASFTPILEKTKRELIDGITERTHTHIARGNKNMEAAENPDTQKQIDEEIAARDLEIKLRR